MAACGGWSIFCYPHFLAAENGGNAVKRAARGCRPWTPQVPFNEGTSRGWKSGIVPTPLFAAAQWSKCRGFVFYRFLLEVLGSVEHLSSRRGDCPHPQGRVPSSQTGRVGKGRTTGTWFLTSQPQCSHWGSSPGRGSHERSKNCTLLSVEQLSSRRGDKAPLCKGSCPSAHTGAEGL